MLLKMLWGAFRLLMPCDELLVMVKGTLKISAERLHAVMLTLDAGRLSILFTYGDLVL